MLLSDLQVPENDNYYLLSRFYDLDSGVITIDGKDISKVRKTDLRKKIGMFSKILIYLRERFWIM